jgi:hypothetical protein
MSADFKKVMFVLLIYRIAGDLTSYLTSFIAVSILITELLLDNTKSYILEVNEVN